MSASSSQTMELGSLEYPADLTTDPLKRCPVYNNQCSSKARVKGGKLDFFLQVKTATTIVNAKGQPRRNAPKQLVDKHDTLGKFLMAKNTIEGRQTAQSARNELHVQRILKIQESGEKTQVRLKQERKATMELTEKKVGMMVQFDRAGQRIAKESNSLLALLNKTVQDKEEAASSFIPA
ncbi:MAG: hypothetical protein Q9203_006849 [Teloschistes exilis]